MEDARLRPFAGLDDLAELFEEAVRRTGYTWQNLQRDQRDHSTQTAHSSHAPHAVKVGLLSMPSSHVMQNEAPGLFWYEPGGQTVHVELASVSVAKLANRPALHSKQTPPSEYWPGPQQACPLGQSELV